MNETVDLTTLQTPDDFDWLAIYVQLESLVFGDEHTSKAGMTYASTKTMNLEGGWKAKVERCVSPYDAGHTKYIVMTWHPSNRSRDHDLTIGYPHSVTQEMLDRLPPALTLVTVRDLHALYTWDRDNLNRKSRALQVFGLVHPDALTG